MHTYHLPHAYMYITLIGLLWHCKVFIEFLTFLSKIWYDILDRTLSYKLVNDYDTDGLLVQCVQYAAMILICCGPIYTWSSSCFNGFSAAVTVIYISDCFKLTPSTTTERWFTSFLQLSQNCIYDHSKVVDKQKCLGVIFDPSIQCVKMVHYLHLITSDYKRSYLVQFYSAPCTSTTILDISPWNVPLTLVAPKLFIIQRLKHFLCLHIGAIPLVEQYTTCPPQYNPIDVLIILCLHWPVYCNYIVFFL